MEGAFHARMSSSTAQAKRDSHPVIVQQPNLRSAENWLDIATKDHGLRVADDISSWCHHVANTPSVALFRVKEHIVRHAPELSKINAHLKYARREAEARTYDADYAHLAMADFNVSAVDTFKNISLFMGRALEMAQTTAQQSLSNSFAPATGTLEATSSTSVNSTTTGGSDSRVTLSAPGASVRRLIETVEGKAKGAVEALMRVAEDREAPNTTTEGQPDGEEDTTTHMHNVDIVNDDAPQSPHAYDEQNANPVTMVRIAQSASAYFDDGDDGFAVKSFA